MQRIGRVAAARYALIIAALMSESTMAGHADAARRVLDEEITSGRTPGLQYLLVSRDAVLFSHAAGFADLPNQTPVTPDTSFNAYSVGKTLTAGAILMLVRDHKLDIDRPVASYVPDLGIDPRPTVRETLSHTAGFGNPIPISWVHLASEHDAFDERDFVRSVIRKHGKLESQPGRQLKYSNVGYLVLGEVVARVSGLPYTKFVHERLIAPLSLRDGAVLAFAIPNPSRHAFGYQKRWNWLNALLGFFIERDRFISTTYDGWSQFRHFYANGPAYGGIIGNARGFARYAQAMMDDGGLFNNAERRLLFEPATIRTGERLQRGLGWSRGELDGEAYVTHSGGAAGYYCEVRIYTARKLASIVMMNRTGIRREKFLDRVDRYFLSRE